MEMFSEMTTLEKQSVVYGTHNVRFVRVRSLALNGTQGATINSIVTAANNLTGLELRTWAISCSWDS